MNDVASAVAAPITATIGGKEWTLTPLPLNALGRLARWQKMNAAKAILSDEGLKDVLTASERQQVIKDAMADIDMSEATNFDIDSICYMLWLAAKPNHPGLTFEEFAPQVRVEDMEALNLLAGGLMQGGDLKSLEDENDSDDPKAETPAAGKES